jgi:hypothetical protein
VVGGGSSGGTPIVTKSLDIYGSLSNLSGDTFQVTTPMNMKVTMMEVSGCTQWSFKLSGGGDYLVRSAGTFTFPYPMDFTQWHVFNVNTISGCNYSGTLYGY